MGNKKEDNGKQILREAAPRLIEQEYVVKAVASTSKLTERVVPKSKMVLPMVDNIIPKQIIQYTDASKIDGRK
jgi:hypothetical protein